jgi:2-polyprenyl-3-methyl-5-hydroxy-6-metoxy-1,4-benzoquinol methylase
MRNFVTGGCFIFNHRRRCGSFQTRLAVVAKIFHGGLMLQRNSRSPKIFLIAFGLVMLAALPVRAQLGSRDTQEWIRNLDRPERIAGLKIDKVLPLLKLKPGDKVADIGAGAGAFSLPLGRAVAPSGKVYAVDIDAGLLEYIAQKAKKENVDDIETVKGEFSDPKLPVHDVDLGFFHDVLHHIENRQAYLKALATYLRPNGRIALIEMNRDDPKTPHRNSLEMLVSKDEVKNWMAAAGFYPAEEFDLFGKPKWFIVYSRQR